MSIRTFLFSLLPLFFLTACQKTSTLKEVEAIFSEVKKEYAPDKRVALFNLELKDTAPSITISGTTNLPEAKQLFLKRLSDRGVKYEDQIRLLPDSVLGQKTYGLVNVSVCNIRTQPGHSQELSTQSLLGTPLRILEQKENWYRVQTPDQYIAWLDHGGFVRVSETTYKEWISAPKVIYVNDFGFSFESPDIRSQKISDLVAGNLLKSVGIKNGFLKVEYPDGREAYVPKNELVNFDSWLASRSPTPENILATAQEFLGRPYLWGGTSGKGMDCSGFTKSVFYLNGIQLERDASQQVNAGKLIETDPTLQNALPGDLLFFGRKATETKKERITHVGIYMGQGLFIHASGDAGVKIESLVPGVANFNEDRLKSFVKAKRLLESIGDRGIEQLAKHGAYNPSKL